MTDMVSYVRNNRDILDDIGRTTKNLESIEILAKCDRETLTMVNHLRALSEGDAAKLFDELSGVESGLVDVVRSARTRLAAVVDFFSKQEPFEFSSRFLRVDGHSFVRVRDGGVFMRLVFINEDEEMVTSDQDYEDSLGIVADIMRVLAREAVSIRERFGASERSIELGNRMQNLLDKIEEHIKEIRRSMVL